MKLYETKPIGLIQKERKSNMGYPDHLHSYLELCFVLEGSVICRVNDMETVAKVGDALLIFPYQIHEYPYEKNRQGQFILLNIPTEVYKPYQSFITQHYPLTPLIPGFAAHDEIKSILEIILAADTAGLPYQMCLGFTVGILGAVLQSTELGIRSAKHDTQLPSILEYCGAHYHEKITLEGLSKVFYVNQSSLSRLFNHTLGVSFNDYINLLRVEEAADLLKTTSLPVTDIADRVGYANVRSLNRAFAKHRGTAPSALRALKGEKS